MSEFSHGLLIFSVVYAAYALGSFVIAPSESRDLLVGFPKAWFLAPVRLVLWALLLPMSSVFESLLLAFTLFCLGGLLLLL
jgi:hypothetical protein